MSRSPREPAARRWLLLLTVTAGLLLITLDNTVLYTALPTLTTDLGATSSQGLWIINAYPLAMAGLLLAAGTLGDRVGHRPLFMTGLAVFGLASLAAAFSPTPGALIAARALLGVGAAAMMPATLALIRVTFHDERERNVAIALWGSMAIVGSALGPVVGGLLLARFWWGSVFLVNVPVVLVALAATPIFAPRPRPDSGRPWDLVSSVLALATLSGLVVVIKEAVRPDAAAATAGLALVVVITAGAFFVRRQGRLAHPLLALSLFRSPAFLSGAIAAAVTLFAMAGIQLAITQRFQLVEGYTPLEAGLLVSAAALGSLPTALIGGAILHRVGLRPLISGGMVVAALAALLVIAGLRGSTVWVAAALTLCGAGLGCVMAVASTAIIGSAPVHRAGMAASVEEVAYEFGNLIAVAFLGSILGAVYTATVVLPDGIPESARDSMVAALVVAETLPAGEALVEAASAAFDRGFRIVMALIIAVLAVAAAATAILLRPRRTPGPQATSPE